MTIFIQVIMILIRREQKHKKFSHLLFLDEANSNKRRPPVVRKQQSIKLILYILSPIYQLDSWSCVYRRPVLRVLAANAAMSRKTLPRMKSRCTFFFSPQTPQLQTLPFLVSSSLPAHLSASALVYICVTVYVAKRLCGGEQIS